MQPAFGLGCRHSRFSPISVVGWVQCGGYETAALCLEKDTVVVVCGITEEDRKRWILPTGTVQGNVFQLDIGTWWGNGVGDCLS